MHACVGFRVLVCVLVYLCVCASVYCSALCCVLHRCVGGCSYVIVRVVAYSAVCYVLHRCVCVCACVIIQCCVLCCAVQMTV